MQAVTKNYLLDIIERQVYRSIHKHRQSKKGLMFYDMQNNWPVTDDELVEFILLIPFFDDGLKDFLLGNIPEHTTIISQTWETEFIKNCNVWATSNTWLLGKKFVDNEDWKESSYSKPLSLPY